MLHIVNGDATADLLKQSNLTGELLSWREALIMGPSPNVAFDDWIVFRSEHLARTYQQKAEACKASLLEQEARLRTFAQHEETVLWFEYDLFCQIHLIYLLNFFSRQEKHECQLSLICIDAFPGIENFKGLGQLGPEQLVSLFGERKPIPGGILDLAQHAWTAYCSPDPGDIERFLKTDTRGLPFLAAALEAHLRRFPAMTDGLGRVEKVALNLIECGVDEFKPLFHMFAELEPLYGFGDNQFWAHLKHLSQLREPLVKIYGIDNVDAALSAQQFANASFAITDKGKAVLNGHQEFDEFEGWLGGVHLNGRNNSWRWDEQHRRIIQR
ncbi:MAG: hypothetical protein ACE5G1_18155 [bacterium]